MKKLITGAIAGSVGIALLFGGAGTFALWTSQATVGAPAVMAGHLTLNAGSAGKWQENGVDVPAGYKIIPGKTVTYKQTLTIDAEGKDLKADLTWSGGVGTGSLVTSDSITQSVSVVPAAGQSNITATGSTVSISQPGIYTVDATITVTFPSTKTTGQDESLTFSNAVFNLTQKTGA